MEVRFSEALPLEKALRGNAAGAGQFDGDKKLPPITVMPNRSSEAVNPAGGLEEEEQTGQPFAREAVTELVKRSAELLSVFDRELKYEMKDDAGVVQIQVIDPSDGRVVRKVPADEVIKFIEHIKSQIDDRIDVRA